MNWPVAGMKTSIHPRNPRTPGVAIVLAATILSAGCATYVPVQHIVAPGNLGAEDVGHLARIVVVMELAAPDKPAGLLGAAAKKAVKRHITGDAIASFPMPRAEALAMLQAAAAGLTSSASSVVAYFIKGASSTTFIDDLNATAVLMITPSRLTAIQERRVRRTRDGRKVTAYVIESDFAVEYQLLSWPGRRTLAKRRYHRPLAVANTQAQPLAAWMRAQHGHRRAWLRSLTRDLLPTGVIRSRLLQKKGKTPGLKPGVKAAKKGNWNAARKEWEDGLAKRPDFRLFWNLGLYHERLGNWREADDHYQRAMDRAPDIDERATLARYRGELSVIYKPPATGATQATTDSWFGSVMAVMPLANDTNDVGAPERVRNEIQKRLKAKGYPMLALEEVTSRMRSLGVSDGAHLKAFSPDKIAHAAGSNRIISGRLLEFKNTNIGVYHLTHVSLALKLTDENGNVLWESVGDGFQEVAIQPKHAGEAFLVGLIGTAVTKITRTHLQPEIRAAVMNGLESLPARPAAGR